MRETGIEGYYALVNGKKLRFGYTTGTCAAGAAKAACLLLLTGHPPETVRIATPKGIVLTLEVLEPALADGVARCAIRKFSGDDPDVTDGVLVYARVRAGTAPGVAITGGVGVGRVTKPGLKEPVGEAAINPGPRAMIRQAVEEALSDCGRDMGVAVEISVPEGVEIAKRTFNPRLGIEGGISILGTSGIVEPMSEEALLESIRLEIRQKRALGQEQLILVPGNYGADFLRREYGIPDERMVKCSNFIGKALDMAAEAEFHRVFLAGNLGKMVKLAGGVMNTHSREADARGEVMAGCALRAGADADTARTILDCVTTDEMLRVVDGAGLLKAVSRILGERIGFYLNARVKGQFTVSALVFSDVYGLLCRIGPEEPER